MILHRDAELTGKLQRFRIDRVPVLIGSLEQCNREIDTAVVTAGNPDIDPVVLEFNRYHVPVTDPSPTVDLADTVTHRKQDIVVTKENDIALGAPDATAKQQRNYYGSRYRLAIVNN